MYYIIRVFFKGDVEAHSIEQRETRRQGLARFYNVAAADIGNNDVTYSYTLLIDEEGTVINDPIIFCTEYDELGDIVAPFPYMIARIRIKNNTLSTSIEYKHYNELYKRYFNIIAADLQDEAVSYNMAIIINGSGEVVEQRNFTNINEE